MIARHTQMEFAAKILVCFLNQVCSWFSHASRKPRRLKEISKKGGEGDVEPGRWEGFNEHLFPLCFHVTRLT